MDSDALRKREQGERDETGTGAIPAGDHFGPAV